MIGYSKMLKKEVRMNRRVSGVLNLARLFKAGELVAQQFKRRVSDA